LLIRFAGFESFAGFTRFSSEVRRFAGFARFAKEVQRFTGS